MVGDFAVSSAEIVDSRGQRISGEVANELNRARLVIQPFMVAARLWRRLLTAEDRRRLGGSLESAYQRLGTARMWQEARGVSLERAVVDVARGVGRMSEATARWLSRELALDDPPPPADRPIWHPEKGKLCFGSRVIRRVRMMRNPSNIQQILDAFQGAGWPSRIDNPLGTDQQRLHQALRSLNGSLEMIRFRSQEGGGAISWERI